MSASFSLKPGERILWQSCPAPRAYVFRRWRLSLACMPFWLGLGFWLALDMSSGGDTSCGWFVWRVGLWMLVGCGAVGHLFVARCFWRWERYMLTDSRIRIRCGWLGRHEEQLTLPDVELYRVVPLAGSLATVRLRSRVSGKILTLHCLEGASIFVGFLLPGTGENPLTA